MKISRRVLQLSIGFFLVACGPDKGQNHNPETKDQDTAPGNTGATSKVPGTGDSTGQDAAPGTVKLGEECSKDEDCESKLCLEEKFSEDADADVVKLCSACRDDAQCVAEKRGLACQYSFASGARKCVDGELGSPCSKKEHCSANLMCALVNMGDNKSDEKTCSECAKHIDCPETGKRNCVSRDLPSEKGRYFNKCLEDGSRQTGEVCFPCETGNRECAEGFCVKVELEEGLDDDYCIGVCGACHTDADCAEDSRCVPPSLNFEGDGIAPHTGSKCVKKG